MTRDEIKKYLTEVNTAYPKLVNLDDPKLTVDIWHEAFDEMEYEFAHKALIEHIKEGAKQPTINELYQRAKAIKRIDFFDKGGRI